MKELMLLPLLVVSCFANAQNVGIGTSAPSEKLEVIGHVKANSFKFTTPKTLYAVVPAAAFQKQSEADNIERYMTGVFYNNPTGNPMIAPVQLPQGATITGFTVYYLDNSPVANVTVSLHFYNFLGFIQAIATVSSSGEPGFGNGTVTTFTGPTVVNYQTGLYSVDAYASNSAWPGFDLQVSAIVITYTMSATN